MRPTLCVVTLSESFSQLWPKLAASSGAELRSGHQAADLGDLQRGCCVIVAAGGAEGDAAAAVEQLHARGATMIAVVGVEPDYRLATTLLRSGADNYFVFPGDLGPLRSWLQEHFDRIIGEIRARSLAESGRQLYDFSRMVGRSPSLREALQSAEKFIPRANATVLITGETGTGKELLARAIHYNGPRAAKPFVEINCTALPENLLEAELFGYEAGAFTDARAPKQGLLEAADGGSLFLDEIGDMSLSLQAKLLRVLETKRVRRLGSVRDHTLDVRIIAATHVDLRDAIASGRFREDLFYRLGILPIHLPPLRERGDDVVMLAEYFLDRLSTEYSLPRPPMTQEIVHTLLTHSWPGNIRELRNAVERVLLLDEGTVIHARHLFLTGRLTPRPSSAIPFPATLDVINQAAARAMVESCGGNKSEAAKALGISRRYLYVLLSRGEESTSC